MGVSIYYVAKRDKQLAIEEEQEIKTVINNYNESFPHGDTGESFCVYEADNEKTEVVFEGSTRLPLSDALEETMGAISHWSACLSEIRRVIPNAEWSVQLDDTDFFWDDETGWSLPME